MSVKATKTVKNVVKMIGAATVVIVLGMAGCGDDGGNPGGGGGDGGGGGRNITYGSVTDSRDGKSYRTVRIGNQTWMAENLNFNAENSRCYDDDPANCAKYGRLYDWSTVMGFSSGCNSSSCASQVQSRHRGICPVGWHVPSDAEWETLVNFAGGSSTAGTKLKSATGWYINTGTDDFGFSALPGGYGFGSDFDNAGNYGIWWSATEIVASFAWARDMHYIDSGVGRNYYSKTNLFAARCLED
jgi:uncharacterized protein (TIGR02145 family)